MQQLTVPHDTLIYNARHWDVNAPFFFPPIEVHADVQPWLGVITALTANEIINRATTNPLRIVTFNLTAQNEFQNNEFYDIVSIAADLIAYVSNGRAIDSNIQVCVGDAVQFYSAMLLNRFPMLSNDRYVQGLQRDCEMVIGKVGQMLQDIERRKTTALRGGGGYGGYQQPMGGYQRPMGSVNQPFQQGSYFPPGANTQSSLARGGYSSRPSVGGINNRYSNVVNNPSNFSPNGVQIDVKPNEIVREPEVKEVKEHYVKTMGGSEMEKEIADQGINFYGQLYNLSSICSNNEVKESVKKLASTNAGKHDGDDLLYPSRFVEPTISSAIMMGRMAQLEQTQKNNANKVFRCFAMICRPILYNYNFKEYMDRLYRSTSFSDLGKNIQSITEALLSKRDNADKNYNIALLDVMNQVDNILTSMMNEFLKYKLETSIQIDSFAEDVGDLVVLIRKKYGESHMKGLARFQNEFIGSLEENMDEKCIQNAKDCIGTNESISVSTFMYDVSLTYLSMNSKTLGLNVKNEPLVIDKDIMPTLYSLAESLTRHKAQDSLSSLNDYIILPDDVSYKIYTSYITEGKYTLIRNS